MAEGNSTIGVLCSIGPYMFTLVLDDVSMPHLFLVSFLLTPPVSSPPSPACWSDEPDNPIATANSFLSNHWSC